MKIPRAMRLSANLIEYTQYVRERHGTGATEQVEKLLRDKAEREVARDPHVRKILEKTPADYEKDKALGRGIFSRV